MCFSDRSIISRKLATDLNISIRLLQKAELELNAMDHPWRHTKTRAWPISKPCPSNGVPKSPASTFLIRRPPSGSARRVCYPATSGLPSDDCVKELSGTNLVGSI